MPVTRKLTNVRITNGVFIMVIPLYYKVYIKNIDFKGNRRLFEETLSLGFIVGRLQIYYKLKQNLLKLSAGRLEGKKSVAVVVRFKRALGFDA